MKRLSDLQSDFNRIIFYTTAEFTRLTLTLVNISWCPRGMSNSSLLCQIEKCPVWCFPSCPDVHVPLVFFLSPFFFFFFKKRNLYIKCTFYCLGGKPRPPLYAALLHLRCIRSGTVWRTW